MTPEERQKLLAILAGHLLLVFLSLNLSPGPATPPQKLFTSNCIPTLISFRDVYLAPCFSIMHWRPFGGHLGSVSMGRQLQRLSRRTGVHAPSPCPQAKRRSCCPPRSLRHGVDVHFACRCRLVLCPAPVFLLLTNGWLIRRVQCRGQACLRHVRKECRGQAFLPNL